MTQAVAITAPRRVKLVEVEERPLAGKEVRVKTWFSGISAGTELTQYRGSNVNLRKQWDGQRRLFLPSREPSQPYPLVGPGYEEVGEVIETGPEVTQVKTGEVVFGAWGHRTHAILEEEYASKRLKPPDLDPLLAIFSHIGPVALNGILDANLHIGEEVAIFGLGVPGQIAAQLAKRSGARVFGVDPIEKRLSLACELGAVDVPLNPDKRSPAEAIKELTGGRGADAALEISGNSAALHEAIRATAYSARVVALGFYQGAPGGLDLGEEFHHNRIQLICSQISNVDPALSYRWDRLRLVHTIMELQVQGLLNLRPLISHILPFEQAAEAYRLLDEAPQEALQVVLEFPKEQKG